MQSPPPRSPGSSSLRPSGAVLLALLAPVLAAQGTDLAALVNPNNATKEVSRADLTRLFRAETRYWKNDKRVEILLPRSGSPEKDFLLRNVYRMNETELKRYWIELIYQNKITAPPKVMPSAAVTQVVLGKQDGGLGLVPADAVREKGVKTLRVDGKLPGDEGYWLHVEDDEKQEQDGSPGGGRNVGSGEARDASGRDGDEQDDLLQRLELLELEVAALSQGDELAPTFEFGGLKLRGFGDVTIHTEDAGNGKGSGSFALGQLDLFMNARLSERSHFLCELVFESNDGGDTVSDIERLVVSYDVGQSFTIRAGRIHTALGLWNARFHHGEWLQTTVERPAIVEFEDSGGLLPVHLIGLSAEYRAPFEAVGVEAYLQVGNGRGPQVDEPQATDDLNDPKAINVQVTLQPAIVPGLVVGGGLYLDDIPANTDAGAGPLHGPLDEEIVSVFGSWTHGQTAVLAELYEVEHDGAIGHAGGDGWFVQLEHQLGDWTPYARLESRTVDADDTYFPVKGEEDLLVLGVRWDYSTWNAFKLQLESGESIGAPGEDYEALVLQAAFAF
jgi:hypothetical protein